MDVVSACALPVTSLLWQRNTTWVLTVVCKGTFSLRPGEMTIAPEQDAPNEDDAYWNDDPMRSARSVSDLAPLKPKVDVLLVGAAFAPRGRQVTSLVARLAVGDLDKSIEVWGDRTFDPSGAPSAPAPFSRLPLTYERAAGGPKTWNPVGVPTGTRNRQGYAFLPNLQRCGQVVNGPDDIIAPVGFGPLAPSWPSRRDKLGGNGPNAGGWRAPLLLDDFDLAFFNAAPPDQQIESLREDAKITLENLHPDHALLTTAAPPIRPHATVEANRGTRPLALVCDTIWIDTDRSICTLTWRGHMALAHAAEAGRIIVSLDKNLHTGRKTTETLAPVQTPSKAPSLSARDGDPALPTFAGPMDLLPGGLPFTPVANAPSSMDPARQKPPDIGLPFPPAQPKDTMSQPASRWTPSSPPPPLRPSQAAPPWLDPAPREADLAPPTPPVPATIGQMGAFAATPPAAPSRPPVLAHAGEAAFAGLAAASNAAAPPPKARLVVVPSPTAEPARAQPTKEPALDEGTVLQLVWYDPDAIPRIRRKPSFHSILEALDARALDPEVDDPAFAAEPIDVEDRREVHEILACAEAVTPENVGSSLAACVRKGSKLVALLDLFAGEISFPFDDLEKLKATMTTVAPLALSDEALKSAVEAAKDFVAMPGLSSTSSVAEGLTKRLKDTYGATPRATPHGYVDTQTERALLEQRHYQRRVVLGAKHIRALLGSGAHATPVYLPDALAAKLPMFQRFKARLIAEVHPRVDQFESHAAALKVVALGWVMPAPTGK